MKTTSDCLPSFPSGPAEDVSNLYPCFCELPASWFLADFPDLDATGKKIEELEASDLFELLCDTCFDRAVTEKDRCRWAPVGRA
jgi:hypothetical protein